MRISFVFLVITLFSIQLYAQSDAKIEKQLNRLFQKGKYEKCYKKALKFNRKTPKSYIPEFYISKISMHNYSSGKLNSRSGYSQLQRAVRYSLKLPDYYSIWQNEIRDSLEYYIIKLHDSGAKPSICKQVIQLYIKSYSDTISLYTYYFGGFIPEETTNTNRSYLSTEDSLRWVLIRIAEQQDGIRYRYGGETPETGFDCSGFTKYVYGQVGIEIPHNAQKQSNLDGINKPLEEARPGDLVFFGSQYQNGHRAGHAGIIHSVQDGEIKVVHCVSGGVSIDGKNSSWDRYWKDKVIFVKTIDELTEEIADN